MSSWQVNNSDQNANAEAADVEASALFEQHRARVYRFCLGRLGNREDAADAVQDTYAKAWGALRDGSDVHQPLAWLLTIAGNVCTSRHRARSARPVEVPLSDEAAAATVTHLSRIELAGLPAALRALPDGQRRAFVLRELRGCSYEEICDDLGPRKPRSPPSSIGPGEPSPRHSPERESGCSSPSPSRGCSGPCSREAQQA